MFFDRNNIFLKLIWNYNLLFLFIFFLIHFSESLLSIHILFIFFYFFTIIIIIIFVLELWWLPLFSFLHTYCFTFLLILSKLISLPHCFTIISMSSKMSNFEMIANLNTYFSSSYSPCMFEFPFSSYKSIYLSSFVPLLIISIISFNKSKKSIPINR